MDFAPSLERRRLKLDKVAGFLEVDRTNDTHEVIINNPTLKPDPNHLGAILLSPRHARHLANVLIEYATYAEAEAAGRNVESRHYRRRSKVQELSP
jgi:hypothetical protein